MHRSSSIDFSCLHISSPPGGGSKPTAIAATAAPLVLRVRCIYVTPLTRALLRKAKARANGSTYAERRRL
jgi:hypothetical protein